MRTDGTFIIYKIQHQEASGEFVASNFDWFGTPPGFSASDSCWQTTGVMGTFDEKIAKKALKWMRAKHKDHTFRTVAICATQITTAMDW